MADHPLRSATYHGLGRPLPHQLTNTPRDHLRATAEAVFRLRTMRFKKICGISIRFRMLSPTPRQISHVLLTRSPLIRTLQAECFSVRLACIRHAASVRPEPGSNSPKREIRLARFSCWHHLRCPNCVSSTNGVSRSKRFYSSTFCCSVFNVHSCPVEATFSI